MSRSARARGRRGKFNPRAGFEPAPTGPNISAALLKQARKSGQLNLSNRGLEKVPDTVWRINLDVPEEAKNVTFDGEDRWWEQVDLTKLILASNKLSELSPDLNQLPALVVLDVHDNELTSLPKEIGDLQHLQKLNVSHNKLQSLPPELCHLTNLLYLHVDYNKLTELPNDLGTLEHIEDLDLSHNELATLPPSIGYVSRLTKFNASNNKLANLPPEIGDLHNIRVLDLSNNQLEYLPSDVGRLGKLEQLYIKYNKLREFPNLQQCEQLKELHAGFNLIGCLSADHLKLLPGLVLLDLRDNKLTSIPEEITHMQHLQRLELSNNDLSSLPFSLGLMSSLKSVNLDGNPLRTIRRDVIQRGTSELLKYLRTRIEEPKGGDAAPLTPDPEPAAPGSTIDTFTVHKTKSINYSNKNAASVPDDLLDTGRDMFVSDMNLSKNVLTTFPVGLVQLAATLTDLNLSFNKLSALGAEIGQLTRLTTLDLRNNQLSALPTEVENLQHLREVAISINRFQQFPSVLYSLVNLENIFANDNHIAAIDVDGLLKLPALATLDLQNNDIMQVPPQLGNVTSLRSLQLGGNPFRVPRPAILAKSTADLLEYLRGRIPT
ncbi:leucine-rich repeat-containing protein 40-like isoform X2 [Branchiostoma floridae]|uniref:Leucine-rich repeat-containing protein 40 n=1 Tax=Branchiostoma floridae TaxID=7739 RepID=A0A9J7MDQ2_BRAFL|nr:leucine-rich repeat-containing protein 40-like isoform X2 [Branchiostoma floridae]